MTSSAQPATWALRLVIVMGAAALVAWFLGRPSSATSQMLAHDFSSSAEGFEQKKGELDEAVMLSGKRATLQSDSWLASEYEAMALHSRAQLTGDFDDIRQADAILSKARDRAPDGSGPLFTSAAVAFSAHRNNDARLYLEAANNVAVSPRRLERAEAAALAGDLALYSGDYSGADEQYERARALFPGPSIALRRANLQQRLGNFDGGLQILAQSIEDYPTISAQLGAVLLLSGGGMELKRGNWDEARALFERAESIFPGYWLTSAHIAQLDAATGDYHAAASRYASILEDREEPSVMAAYAPVLEALGRSQDAARLDRRSQQIYAREAQDYPEAFADHLLDSLLEGAPAAALKAARQNHAARPYGDSKVGVARALIANDRPSEARTILEQVIASGWRSTEQYVALAEACARLEDAACVTNAQAEMEDFNSRALDAGSDFLAFGNH